MPHSNSCIQPLEIYNILALAEHMDGIFCSMFTTYYYMSLYAIENSYRALHLFVHCNDFVDLFVLSHKPMTVTMYMTHPVALHISWYFMPCVTGNFRILHDIYV